MRAIRIHTYGGPEVLQWEELEVGEPGPGEVRLRHAAIGLNFIDIYERTGLYKVALPAVLGKEAAGVVEALGSGVKHINLGDRVAYAGDTSGAYCEQRVMPAARLVRIPDSLDDSQAAAVMLKGLTAQMLLRQTYRVRRGDVLLIHAAAGGVGSILVQWAKHLGAKVIAVVGSDAKAALVRELGADQVVLDGEDWVAATKAATAGRGVDVVYDSVGKQTFMRSLDCLRPRGLMVTYGNASGAVEPFAPLELTRRGSLYVTRPTLFHYIATRPALARAAQELFDVLARSVVRVQIGQSYPLQEAARAHVELEARRTTGSTVLLP
jgi:NADPH:quinone reductase